MASTILITRPIDQAKRTQEALGKKGLQTLIDPLLTIIYHTQLEQNLKQLFTPLPQALLITSSNSLRALGPYTKLLPKEVPVICIGTKTAELAASLNFSEIINIDGTQEKLIDYVQNNYTPSQGPLAFCSGNVIIGNLTETLQASKFQVKHLEVYHTLYKSHLNPETTDSLLRGNLDGVCLYSPKTAECFAQLCEESNLTNFLAPLHFFCISENVASSLNNLPLMPEHIHTSKQTNHDSLLELMTNFFFTAS